MVQVGSSYGVISRLQSRFVAVRTRDGIEHLIPNETLLVTTVVSWSFSDRKTRLKIPVGVAYDTDLRLALRLMTEAAARTPRVLVDPAPAGRLMQFGESSVDLELRFWIRDPENGVVNVSSEIRLRIWDAFREHGISFPYPQRDVHLTLPPGAALPGSDTPRAPA